MKAKQPIFAALAAQRYPWDGTVDVGYRATFWPKDRMGKLEVTVGESVTTNEFALAGQGAVTGAAAIPMPAEVNGKARFKAIVE